jgi:hypothetical protein
MKAVTYFNEVESLHDPALLELWKASWAKFGWEPVVLTIKDALETDPDMVERFQKSPLLKSHPGNPSGYVWACLVRWVAQLKIKEPSLLLDWDVICNGYKPEDAPKETNDFRPVFLAGGLCPCAVAGRHMTWQMICAWLEFAPFAPNFSTEALAKDNADQYAIAYVMPKEWAIVDPKSPCIAYQNEGWKTAPMIHFPNQVTSYPRSEVIKHELGILGNS